MKLFIDIVINLEKLLMRGVRRAGGFLKVRDAIDSRILLRNIVKENFGVRIDEATEIIVWKSNQASASSWIIQIGWTVRIDRWSSQEHCPSRRTDSIEIATPLRIGRNSCIVETRNILAPQLF